MTFVIFDNFWFNYYKSFLRNIRKEKPIGINTHNKSTVTAVIKPLVVPKKSLNTA
jgi:hypothetical protein